MNYTTIGIIAGSAIVVIVIGRYIWRTYNELTWHGIQVDKQSSNVDVHLTKKYALIPALVNVVKGFAKHESQTFEEVTRLRSQWGASKNVDDKVRTANQLDSALSRLLVIQERYPNLKANRSFGSLMKSMSHIEKELVHERKYYNERVRAYNVRVQLFPRNIVAKIFSFKEKPFFAMER